MNISLTHFPRLTDAQGKCFSTTWPRLIERLTKPQVVSSKDDAQGFSFATFKDNRRALANVEAVFAVGLDFDHDLDWDHLIERFDASDSFAHTTHSSTDAAPRARVFLRLSRPVSGDEYRRVYAAVASIVEAGGLVIDRKASDPSRFWFLPSVPVGGTYRYSIGRGPAVNVNAALASVPPPRAPSAPLPSSQSQADASVEKRANAYLAKCEPAISGSGGHNVTFVTAIRLVRGFALDEDTAFRLLCTWNERCQPPWSEAALRRKLRQAVERGTMPEGALRDADRRAS